MTFRLHLLISNTRSILCGNRLSFFAVVCMEDVLASTGEVGCANAKITVFLENKQGKNSAWSQN